MTAQAIAFYRPVGSVFATATFQHVQSDVPLINPEEMSTEARRELLAQVRAGTVMALRAAIKVFGESENANGLRPRPGSTHELAEGTAGLPFIRGHRMSDVDGRHGVIVASKFEDGEVIDLVEFRSPSSMELLLLLNLGEFSIAYVFAHAECSACGETAANVMGFAEHACECEPGAAFERDGATQFVELHTDGNRRTELSTVNRGAFPGTGIRSAFDAAREGQPVCFSLAPPQHQHPQPPRESTMSQTCTTCEGRAQFGESLASALSSAIEAAITDDTDRAAVIERMGSEAGIDAGTVNQILAGEINCPPLDRLEGFARALPAASLSELRSAAESDGCSYSDDSDEAENQSEEPPMSTENSAAAADAAQATNPPPTPTAPAIDWKARAEAAQKAAFKTIFETDGVAAMKVAPKHREVHQKMFLGQFAGDAAAYRAHLASLAANPAIGRTPMGSGSTEMAGAGAPASRASGGELLATYAVKLGFVKAETFKKKFGKDPSVAAPRNPLQALGLSHRQGA